MKRTSIYCSAAIALLAAATIASAQTIIPPGAGQFNPPPPPPPPPPKISVPVVPQMDAPLRQNDQPPPRPSFSDRISRCLDEGAAGGLGPGDREVYSRSCANR